MFLIRVLIKGTAGNMFQVPGSVCMTLHRTVRGSLSACTWTDSATAISKCILSPRILQSVRRHSAIVFDGHY